ncbi:MAG: hypothetical protein CMI16_08925 [Opitutaceae bacterium]|nr:hypothetical protein [Opitutaceae bacterium]
MIIDCHNHIGADLFFYLNGYSPYAQDLPTMVTEGGRHGIDRWVVFPMVSNLTFDVGAMRHTKLAPGTIENVPYAFENERMLREIYELYPDIGKLTLPFVILDPMRKPQDQVARLRELYQQFAFYGLKIQATMIEAKVDSLLTVGRCFLDLAAELNLPFLIHSSVGDDPWSQAKDILRVAEETPEVRFCLAHSCRYDHECLDRVAELPNTWYDCSAHCIHSLGATKNLEFIAPPERRFPADYSDPSAVLQAMAEAYPTKLIWGSDSPFQSYVALLGDEVLSLRSTVEAESACVHNLPENLKPAIAQDNLLSLLQLKDENVLTR